MIMLNITSNEALLALAQNAIKDKNLSKAKIYLDDYTSLFEVVKKATYPGKTDWSNSTGWLNSFRNWRVEKAVKTALTQNSILVQKFAKPITYQDTTKQLLIVSKKLEISTLRMHIKRKSVQLQRYIDSKEKHQKIIDTLKRKNRDYFQYDLIIKNEPTPDRLILNKHAALKEEIKKLKERHDSYISSMQKLSSSIETLSRQAQKLLEDLALLESK